MPVPSQIGFDLGDQIQPFMKRIPALVIDMGQAIACQADVELGTKLNRFVQLAAHNRSQSP